MGAESSTHKEDRATRICTLVLCHYFLKKIPGIGAYFILFFIFYCPENLGRSPTFLFYLRQYPLAFKAIHSYYTAKL